MFGFQKLDVYRCSAAFLASAATLVERAFASLPASVEHRRFRADSAAYEETTLKWLADKENLVERFTVSADMTPPLRKLAKRVASTEWKVYENQDQETVCYAGVDF